MHHIGALYTAFDGKGVDDEQFCLRHQAWSAAFSFAGQKCGNRGSMIRARHTRSACELDHLNVLAGQGLMSRVDPGVDHLDQRRRAAAIAQPLNLRRGA